MKQKEYHTSCCTVTMRSLLRASPGLGPPCATKALRCPKRSFGKTHATAAENGKGEALACLSEALLVYIVHDKQYTTIVSIACKTCILTSRVLLQSPLPTALASSGFHWIHSTHLCLLYPRCGKKENTPDVMDRSRHAQVWPS